MINGRTALIQRLFCISAVRPIQTVEEVDSCLIRIGGIV